MYSPITFRRHREKQAWTQIHVRIATILTRVHNFSLERGSRIVGQRDVGATLWVCIGIGSVVHHWERERANSLRVGIGLTRVLWSAIDSKACK